MKISEQEQAAENILKEIKELQKKRQEILNNLPYRYVITNGEKILCLETRIHPPTRTSTLGRSRVYRSHPVTVDQKNVEIVEEKTLTHAESTLEWCRGKANMGVDDTFIIKQVEPNGRSNS